MGCNFGGHIEVIYVATFCMDFGTELREMRYAFSEIWILLDKFPGFH